MSVAVGDKIRVIDGIRHKDFKSGQVGTVHQLGVKYEGDIRVKFDHDPDLLWVYSEEYEKEEVEN